MSAIPTTPYTDADPSKISPKVIVSTLIALVVPGLIAVVQYVGLHQEVLGFDNPVLGVLVQALIPGILTFLGGYLKADPARKG